MQRPTLFALAANSIVYTVNTDSSTNITRGRKHSRVKSTLFCMAITVALYQIIKQNSPYFTAQAENNQP